MPGGPCQGVFVQQEYPLTTSLTLQVLLAETAATRALHQREVTSPLIDLEFAPVKSASKAFKPMVREMRFDAGELAIVTFLQAHEAGKPLSLLPATIVGRFQHHCIAYNVERGAVAPSDLAGKRIGVRAYTQTTGMWVRGILQNQYGVDLSRVNWLTFEEAHVEGYRNPPNVVVADSSQKLDQMLLDGELDAAILGNEMPADPRLRTVIADHEAAALQWHRQYGGAIPVNHLAVVRTELAQERPELVSEFFRLLKESKSRAGLAGPIDLLPYGIEALRPGLELAIDYSLQQGLIGRRPAVEELFHESTFGLA